MGRRSTSVSEKNNKSQDEKNSKILRLKHGLKVKLLWEEILLKARKNSNSPSGVKINQLFFETSQKRLEKLFLSLYNFTFEKVRVAYYIYRCEYGKHINILR